MVSATPTIKASEVITNVLREFGDESGAQVREGDVIRWINQGQREIISRQPFNKKVATQTSIPGTESYTLPSDVYAVESISYGGRIFLKNVGYDQARTDLSGTFAKQGEPEFWYEYGNAIYFYPIPNKALSITVNYVGAPNAVSNGSDTIGIPDRYYNSLHQFIMAQVYALDEDWTANQSKLAEFENSMKLLSNVENVTYGAPPVMSDADYEPGGWFE